MKRIGVAMLLALIALGGCQHRTGVQRRPVDDGSRRHSGAITRGGGDAPALLTSQVLRRGSAELRHISFPPYRSLMIGSYDRGCRTLRTWTRRRT